MKTNPGGQLAVDEIIGRKPLCQKIREALQTQSVIMTAERRIGKTSVMIILEERPEENWVPIYTDLEKVQDAMDFATTIYDVVQKYLTTTQRAINRAKKLGEFFGGTEINGYKIPEANKKTWLEILEQSIAVLVEEQDISGKQVLFLWDEFPYMLSNIYEADGEKTTKQVLDSLRALRKDHKNFRMLVTGSIGLHHILKELKKTGYRNNPVNDMLHIEVTPLETKDACLLAKELLAGEGVACDNLSEVTRSIAHLTDNFPFYIHHIIRTLKSTRQKATAESVEAIVQEKLIDDNDPWELKHYETRIRDYFADDATVVKLALDEFVLRDSLSPKTLQAILKQQNDSDTVKDIEKLRALLVQMNLDHYLAKNTSGKYYFRYPLIKRWWKINRELT
jgi:hypothetical protein